MTPLSHNLNQDLAKQQDRSSTYRRTTGTSAMSQKRALEPVEPGMDYPFLDIPAFLRRRAPIEGAECD